MIESTTLLRVSKLPSGKDAWVVIYLDANNVLRLRKRVKRYPGRLGLRRPAVTSVLTRDAPEGHRVAVITFHGGKVECPVSPIVENWLIKNAP